MYSWPFSGGVILELGGGHSPSFRPNLDVRQGPNVDIVADLNSQLPIPSNSYDGVYSSYALEHISWRNIQQVIAEIYRILKPNKYVVLVLPNLYEQMRHICGGKNVNAADLCMLFGDQDYSENAHKSGFSPESINALLGAVGFSNIVVLPHPNCKTDMIVEAMKPLTMENPNKWTKLDRKKYYNRRYFDGDHSIVGGYKPYLDYQTNWAVLNAIVSLKPQNVLEIGAARGYIVKKLESSGIPALGIDISDHCFLTRATNKLIIHDITEIPWPIKDKEYDLLFSKNLLEHIPEQHIGAVSQEMARVSNRGLHGISQSSSIDDLTRCTNKTVKWWCEALPPNHIVCPSDELECNPTIPNGDGKIKLNIGSFTTMFHNGWINIDQIDLSGWAKTCGYDFRVCDITHQLPFNDGSVDVVLASHVIEHLSFINSLSFLRECSRIMKSNGIIRIAVPDAATLIQEYQNGQLNKYDELNGGCAESNSQIAKLWSILVPGHNSAYDYDSISRQLSEVGYTKIHRRPFGVSESPHIMLETIDMYPDISLYIEAIK